MHPKVNEISIALPIGTNLEYLYELKSQVDKNKQFREVEGSPHVLMEEIVLK